MHTGLINARLACGALHLALIRESVGGHFLGTRTGITSYGEARDGVRLQKTRLLTFAWSYVSLAVCSRNSYSLRLATPRTVTYLLFHSNSKAASICFWDTANWFLEAYDLASSCREAQVHLIALNGASHCFW